MRQGWLVDAFSVESSTMAAVAQSTKVAADNRALLVATALAATLVGVLIYAGSAWPIILTDLGVDGSLLLLWLFAAWGFGRMILRLWGLVGRREDESAVH